MCAGRARLWGRVREGKMRNPGSLPKIGGQCSEYAREIVKQALPLMESPHSEAT